MVIAKLVWRRANVTKLRVHGLTLREVTEMIFQAQAWVVDVDDDYPDQVRVIGPTLMGRFITVALEPTDEPEAWRPVTGWPSVDAEIAYHREEYR